MNADPGTMTGVPADDATQAQLPIEVEPSPDDGTTEPTEPAEPQVVPEHDLVGALEAVLLVVDAPVTETALATAVGHRPARVRELLVDLAARYTAASSGIELRELGGGWRFYTRDRFAPVVERFVLDGAQSRLSRAALETLAVVAYRQPVTSLEITEIRGVNTAGVLGTLVERHLVKVVGRKPVVGRPFLYGTTREFLDRFGLNDLADLPKVEDMSELLGFDLPQIPNEPAPQTELPFEPPNGEVVH